jgi:hypothetical protein
MILAMKYMNLINNFVMVAKFDESRCSPINLINWVLAKYITVMILLINYIL